MDKFREYLSVLSSTQPSPGGGSCSCKVLSLAFSVLNKCVNITMARKSYQQKDEETKIIFESISNLFEDDLCFIDECEKKDVESFTAYMNIYKTGTKEQINNVLNRSIKESKQLFDFGYDRIKIMQHIKEHIVASIMPDYYFGIDLIISVLRNAQQNILANAKYLSFINDESKEIIEDVEEKLKEFE